MQSTKIAMRRNAVARSIATGVMIVLVATACGGDPLNGCGGATCPFAPRTHHARVTGRVVTPTGAPVPGARVAAREDSGRQQLWVAGPATSAAGTYALTVDLDLTTDAPDTLAVWVRAALPGDGSDSVRVWLRLVPHAQPPLEARVDVTLGL